MSTLLLPIGVAYKCTQRFKNEYFRCCIAVILKSIPQVTLALIILQQGNDGVSKMAIFIGHCSIMARYYSIVKLPGRSPSKVANLLSEIFNQITWALVTWAYLIV